MAITTVPGATASDQTTLLGTELLDTVTVQSNDTYVDSLQGNDVVNTATAVENVTVNSGDDNDVVTFTAEVLKSEVRAGLGNDKVTTADFTGSIYGSAGDDSIITSAARTVTGALLRGDGGNDDDGVPQGCDKRKKGIRATDA